VVSILQRNSSLFTLNNVILELLIVNRYYADLPSFSVFLISTYSSSFSVGLIAFISYFYGVILYDYQNKITKEAYIVESANVSLLNRLTLPCV